MDDRLVRIVANIDDFAALAQFESNAGKRGALTDGLKKLIRERSAVLGRRLIEQRTGIDLFNLTPAEEKIVQVVSEYAGVMKRQGKDAGRTFIQLRNHGLLDAAEVAVARRTPTQGYKTLADEGRTDLSYEQIIIDYSEEFSARALWFAQRQLGLSNSSDRPPAKTITPTHQRTEALVQWLKARSQKDAGRILPYEHSEAASAVDIEDLQRSGRVFGNVQSRLDYACYAVGLPPLGLTAVSPFDMAWRQEGRSWAFPVADMTTAARRRRWSSDDFSNVLKAAAELPGQAHHSWKKEMADHEDRIRAWALGLGGKEGVRDEAEIQSPEANGDVYWVLVCNPKKWAIDKFLSREIAYDTWGVRKSDASRFAQGQLAVIRVGNDGRSQKDREGKDPLEAGIYALCRIEGEAYPGTGAADEFWSEGERREPGWPTVKIRYLRTFLKNPLSIARLRTERPEASHLLLNGLQASSFPISGDDFRAIVWFLGDDIGDLPLFEAPSEIVPNKLAQIEAKYIRASPEVRERLSRTIERGPIGDLVKKANGYKCQLCEALGAEPFGFRKKNGAPYVEAHHVMPVAMRQIGSLSASNVMTVCANHHRQLHYGTVEVKFLADAFDILIDGISVMVPRARLGIDNLVDALDA